VSADKNKFDESIQDDARQEEPDDDNEAVIIDIADGNEPGEEDSVSTEPESSGDREQEPEEAGKKDKASGRKKRKSAAALEIELKKIKEREEEWKDKYQRLLAEFENARTRSAREQGRMYDMGAKDILARLLPVVDNFERGIDVLSEEEREDPFAQGIIKIYQQLMSVLDQSGVKPMDAVGKEFDPNFHNAVMHEDNEEMGDNLVAEEFQKGYMYKDEVLRHSMVKVVN